MGVALLLGSGLIAFSPLLALYSVYIVHQPYLLILSIGGAFFWLIAALFSGALWYAFALTNVWIFIITESLFFQELFRFAFWYLYKLSLRSKLMETKKDASKLGEEISIGAGVAAAHAIIMFGSILWDSRGPGSFYIDSCPRVPIFFSSAIITCLLSMLDIFWTIIAYEGYRSRSIAKIAFVWVAHFCSSFLSILNTLPTPGMCWIIIFGEFAIVIISGVVLYLTISSQIQRQAEKAR